MKYYCLNFTGKIYFVDFLLSANPQNTPQHDFKMMSCGQGHKVKVQKNFI